MSRSEQAERVVDFLKKHTDEWWCDDCITKALKALDPTRPSNAQTTTKVLPSCCSYYHWEENRACHECGKKRTVTVYRPV